MKTRPSSPGSSPRSGTASATSSSDGRDSTRPTAPSSSWWVIRTTVRRKFGSTSDGDEISSRPTSHSTAQASHSARAQGGDTRERHADPGELHARETLVEDDEREQYRHHRIERAEHRDERKQAAAAREGEQRVGGDVAEADRQHRREPPRADPERLAAEQGERQ